MKLAGSWHKTCHASLPVQVNLCDISQLASNLLAHGFSGSEKPQVNHGNKLRRFRVASSPGKKPQLFEKTGTPLAGPIPVRAVGWHGADATIILAT